MFWCLSVRSAKCALSAPFCFERFWHDTKMPPNPQLPPTKAIPDLNSLTGASPIKAISAAHDFQLFPDWTILSLVFKKREVNMRRASSSSFARRTTFSTWWSNQSMKKVEPFFWKLVEQTKWYCQLGCHQTYVSAQLGTQVHSKPRKRDKKITIHIFFC